MADPVRIPTAFLTLLCFAVGACGQSPDPSAPKESAPAEQTRPTSEPASSEFDLNAQDVAAIKRAIAAETEEVRRNLSPPSEEYPQMQNYGFQAAKFDLNGDGIEEILFRYEGFGFCGSCGCAFRVYQRQGGEYRRLSGTTCTLLPIGVADSRHHGWRDFMITVRRDYVSSGIVPLRFDGVRYPLSWPKEPSNDIGTTVLSEASRYYPLVER